SALKITILDSCQSSAIHPGFGEPSERTLRRIPRGSEASPGTDCHRAGPTRRVRQLGDESWTQRSHVRLMTTRTACPQPIFLLTNTRPEPRPEVMIWLWIPSYRPDKTGPPGMPLPHGFPRSLQRSESLFECRNRQARESCPPGCR